MTPARRLFVLGLLLLPIARPVLGQELAVFVRSSELTGKGRQRIDPRPQSELDARYKATTDSLYSLDKAMRASHGTKFDSWPTDAKRAMRDISRSQARAEVDALYSTQNPEDIHRAEGWISEAIDKQSKKGNIRRVESPDDADAILDVRGLRSAKTVESYIKDNDCRQLLTLRPGGRAGAHAPWAALPADWNFSALRSVARIPSDPSGDSSIVFEAGSGAGNILRCWGKATDSAVDALVELHRVLRATPSAAPPQY